MSEASTLLEGLRSRPKRVSSKYFYDRRGSELFERITRLEEYYPTRTERALLELWAPEFMRELAPRTLVELGAGSAEKTELLLEELCSITPGGDATATYVPVDVSGEFLEQTAARLRGQFPGLSVQPSVGDITGGYPLPEPREAPTLFAFLGSTIGNFRTEAAIQLLAGVRARMAPEDHFLLGVDLKPGPRKSVEELERAYNDRQGVTADFNRNLLSVLNRRFQGSFDAGRFEHLAFYNEEEGRIEMHLVARMPHAVDVAGERIHFSAGERLRTEISCKYDRTGVETLCTAAGLQLKEWMSDRDGRFALALSGPRG
ncbi:MAG: L-histidine N(alpha)-methyltransferase [Gemmatimonadota bacterium]